VDERGGGSLRLAAPWEGGRGERIGGGVERPIKEWMKGERDFCAWLRHGREGEERCVYKRMVFGWFGDRENLLSSSCASSSASIASSVMT